MSAEPKSGRLTVVALAVVAAVLAYRHQSTVSAWVLGIAAVVVLVALARWRGRYVSALLGQRVRIWLRRSPFHAAPAAVRYVGADAYTTVLVRVHGGSELPLDLLTSYLDRFGLLCDSVRVATHNTTSAATTWIALTFSGARNLSALRGRSADVPLTEAAEAAARRLINQLRAIGWTATLVHPGQVPDLVATDAREQWSSVIDARGHVTAYSVDGWQRNLAAVNATEAPEAWTVVEITGSPGAPRITAGAAIRTADRPEKGESLPGLAPIPGRQASALAALHPLSGARLVH